MYDGKKHILIIKGDETIAAGHKIDEQFRTPENELIEVIFMGKNPKEAYINLLKGFNNEQKYITIDELEPKKTKKKIKIKRRK